MLKAQETLKNLLAKSNDICIWSADLSNVHSVDNERSDATQ